jgi:hypothetical protein
MMRQCWICFGEEAEDNVGADMVRPCRCRGTSGWVHHRCLLDWLQVRSGAADLSFASLSSAALLSPSCPQCSTPYVIVDRYALPSPLLRAVLGLRRWRDRAMMASLLGGFGLSTYGLAWAYGLGVYGCTMGLQSLRILQATNLANLTTADSVIKTFVGLPMIAVSALAWSFPGLSWVFPMLPPVLFANDVIRWTWPPSPKLTAVLLPFGLYAYSWLWDVTFPWLSRRWLRTFGDSGSANTESSSSLDANNTSPQLVLSATNLNQFRIPSITTAANNNDAATNSPANNGQQAGGAEEEGDDDEDEGILEDERGLRISLLSITANLALPFFAALAGRLLFSRWHSLHPLHRSILGGLVLLVGQDALHLALWWQRIAIRPFRRILDYSCPEPLELDTNKRP